MPDLSRLLRQLNSCNWTHLLPTFSTTVPAYDVHLKYYCSRENQQSTWPGQCHGTWQHNLPTPSAGVVLLGLFRLQLQLCMSTLNTVQRAL